MIELEAFLGFSNTDLALLEVNLLKESEMSDTLLAFLESKLPSKRSKIVLGVQDLNLSRMISKQLDIKVSSTEEVQELMRGVRLHFSEFFSDKPVIQVIALIESLDKDINLFCMRLKEWYAWHFPELTKVVNDN